MNEEDVIIGYHGTKKENIELICKENFHINLDKGNKLFLGYGIYFFDSSDDALDWNIKNFVKEFKYVPKYEMILDKYGIIESKIKIKENDILDLDSKENLYKLEILIKKFEGKLVTKQEYIRAKNKTSAIINIMYNRKLIDKKLIIKTFFEVINTKELNSLKNFPRKMFCVKEPTIIIENKEKVDISKESFNSVIYFYK